MSIGVFRDGVLLECGSLSRSRLARLKNCRGVLLSKATGKARKSGKVIAIISREGRYEVVDNMIDKLKKREVEFHLRNKRDEDRVKKDLMRRSRLRPDQIRMPDMRLTEEQMRKMGGLAQRLVARLSWVDALVVALKVERPVERRGSYKAVKKWLDSLSGDRAALAERVLAELPK